MLSAGHLLDNRYRLDERIASGGMGDVWRGTDMLLGRVVAVKVLRPTLLSDPEFAARFYGEARMMAAFRHPGVVEVYDYASATDNGGKERCAYLVMAYVEGEPLSTRLKAAGRLSVAETMSIMTQAADALHAAHQNGTVHRDVKPGNLIVKPNGTVILVDFGVARSAAVTSVTGVNAIVGTALYMAPEQVAKHAVTPATDIYALGAVAYHCLSGQPPFEGDNALQVALRHLEEEPDPLPGDVPAPVRALISRAMAKRPEDRFASAAEFADAALEASDPMPWQTTTTTVASMPASITQTIPAMPVPRPYPPAAPPAQPRKTGQIALLGTVLGLLAVAGMLVVVIAFRWFGGGSQGPGTDLAPTGPVPERTTPSLTPTPSRRIGATRNPSHPGGSSRTSLPATVSDSATPPAPTSATPTGATPSTGGTSQPATNTPTNPATPPPTPPGPEE